MMLKKQNKIKETENGYSFLTDTMLGVKAKAKPT